MKLELEGGEVFDHPSPSTIEAALARVDGRSIGFAILSEGEMSYVQAAGSAKAGFALEYQLGSIDRHFGSMSSDVPIDVVVRVFGRYAEGHADWSEPLEWQRMVLKESKGCSSAMLLAGLGLAWLAHRVVTWL